MNKTHLILRNTINDSRERHTLPEGIGPKVKEVWTIIDNTKYESIGLVHNVSAFKEDKMHDWKITKDNELRFYGHSGARGDKHDLVLVLYDK